MGRNEAAMRGLDGSPGAKGKGFPMLLSGLWKLAAMFSVVGVGLVAVYQAQQGMDKTAAVASEDQQSEEGAPDPFGEAQPLSPTPLEAPQEADPFAEEPSGKFNVVQKSSAAKSAQQPTLLPADEQELESPFESSAPAKTASTLKNSPDGPGIDVVDEPEEALTPIAEETKTVEAPRTPTRLPDDLDALEAEVLKATEKAEAPPKGLSGIKPAIRETRPEPEPQEIVPVAANEPADQSDPFAESVPAATVPATAVPVATPEADPFGADPSVIPEPVKPTKKPASMQPAGLGPKLPARAEPVQESDPFAERPTPKTPTLGTPAPIEVENLSSPFSNDIKGANPGPTFTDPEPIPTKKPARRDDTPKLPTSIPDPLDEPSLRNEFPAAQPEPIPARRPIASPERQFPAEPQPLPTRRPADPAPKSLDSDLLGDGTVSTSSPRGVQQPRLTIEKIAPQQATLGEPMVYSIVVKNVGGVEAQQVIVEDRIPKGTEMTGSAPKGEIFEKKLIWRLGTLKPNEEKKISIRVIPHQEGPIGSVARVSFATEVAAEIVVAAPQLSFNVKAPRQARMGETIELTFLLKNTGSGAANNVSVRDLVPAGLKHEASADIECPIGKLAPNESREISLSVVAVKPGRAVNRAILTGDAGISQELESVIEVIGEQLVLTRSGQNKIYVDRPTVFTNNVKNDGNADVKQVRIAEIVPAGMEFVEASDGGRFDPVQKAIFWDLGVLPAGAETVVSSKLVARTPGTQQAKVTATGPAGSSAAVKSEVDVVGRPELQIETVSRTGVVAVGDRLTSKIQLKNHGSAPAKNVSLSIRLPRELKLLEVRGSQYTIRDNVLTFDTVGSISPKELVGIELVMEAVAEADAQMNLEITADHLTKPARRSETVQIAAEIR